MLIIDFNDLWQAEVKVVLNWGQEKESNINFGGIFFLAVAAYFWQYIYIYIDFFKPSH